MNIGLQFIFATNVLAYALALQCYECNGSNGNSDCVLNPSKVPKQTCPSSDDVCVISATYVKPNKSVDYDEKRDLRTMRRLCKGDKSMCNIGVKPWGKCYQTPSETELICETCCRDDLCNTGDLTWKTSNAIQPKVSSLQCYTCTNLEALKQPQPECLLKPKTAVGCPKNHVCEGIATFRLEENVQNSKSFKLKHDGLYSINRQCAPSEFYQTEKWDCKKDFECVVDPNDATFVECRGCCKEDFCSLDVAEWIEKHNSGTGKALGFSGRFQLLVALLVVVFMIKLDIF